MKCSHLCCADVLKKDDAFETVLLEPVEENIRVDFSPAEAESYQNLFSRNREIYIVSFWMTGPLRYMLLNFFFFIHFFGIEYSVSTPKKEQCVIYISG
jgi:hypothetical protein